MPSSEAAAFRARLFDADQPDRQLNDDEALEIRPTDRQLLWVDIRGSMPEAAAKALTSRLDLRPRTEAALVRPAHSPGVALHGTYLHVRVAASANGGDAVEPAWLDVISAPNVVITRHDEETPFLDDFDARIERDAATGGLSSLTFLTTMIDGAVASYHAAVDAIEDDVDRLDALLLRGGARDELLKELIRARRRIARLRRLLADHRSIFTALASPEIGGALDEPDAVSLLQGLATRFDGAMSAVEGSRDALLGSFDIYMSRTAQRTNDVMKVLTIVTVLLLPGTLLAGLFGMNVVLPLEEGDPMSFWAIVAALVVLAIAILVLARLRRWL